MRKTRLVGRLGVNILPLFTSGGLGDSSIPQDMYFTENIFPPGLESQEVGYPKQFYSVLDRYNLEIPQQTQRYEHMNSSLYQD